jgi:hypothetical protein
MKNTGIKKEQKQNRSKKAPALEHSKKEHLSRLVEEETRQNPIGGRFGKKWFPYHK